MYTDKALFSQLSYFAAIFDLSRGLKEHKEPGNLRQLTDQNQDRFASARLTMERYLQNCGRRYVDMGRIFSFM